MPMVEDVIAPQPGPGCPSIDLHLGYTPHMEITLTPHAEALLRSLVARNPASTPAEILKRALAEAEGGVPPSTERLPEPKRLSHEEFQASLDRMAQFSDKIPPMPGETASREMIYQDHD